MDVRAVGVSKDERGTSARASLLLRGFFFLVGMRDGARKQDTYGSAIGGGLMMVEAASLSERKISVAARVGRRVEFL